METFSAQDDLTAYSIGSLVLSHIKQDEVLREVLSAAESNAMRILNEIQEALDDDTLDDPECFKRIEAILTVLENHGITSLRHDW